jgi:hypothetical protein
VLLNAKKLHIYFYFFGFTCLYRVIFLATLGIVLERNDLKNNFLKINKYHFDIFRCEKYFKKQLQPLLSNRHRLEKKKNSLYFINFFELNMCELINKNYKKRDGIVN